MYGYDILHEAIAENLINSVRTGSAGHAYIFEGERGIGTLEAAKLFAAALVCAGNNPPCTQCNACTMAKAGTHPDINFITSPDGKKNITVDVIRTIAKDAYTKPYESKKKVYIITYGDEMNEQAQNAFLKILEEPPEYAVFIILAENHETLLVTIRSRCTMIHFPPAKPEVLKRYLEKKYPEHADKTDFAIKFSGGVFGKAEKILTDESFMPLREKALDRLPDLISKNAAAAYDIAEYLEENKDEVDLIFEFWLSFFRDIMLIQNGGRGLILNSDMFDKLCGISARIDEKSTANAIEQIILAQKMRKRYVSLHSLALRLAFNIE